MHPEDPRHDLPQYLAATGDWHKPWLLLQLRMQKLQAGRPQMDTAAYAAALADIHRDLMTLGEWWAGREAEMFGVEGQAEP